MSLRQYHSALLISPECACVSADSSSRYQSRTASLPSVATTPLCGQPTSLENNPNTTTTFHDPPVSDTTPILPYTNLGMVSAKKINGRSELKLCQIDAKSDSNIKTAVTATTNASSLSEIRSRFRNPLKKQSASLRSVDFPTESLPLVGSSLSHTDVVNFSHDCSIGSVPNAVFCCQNNNDIDDKGFPRYKSSLDLPDGNNHHLDASSLASRYGALLGTERRKYTNRPKASSIDIPITSAVATKTDENNKNATCTNNDESDINSKQWLNVDVFSQFSNTTPCPVDVPSCLGQQHGSKNDDACTKDRLSVNSIMWPHLEGGDICKSNQRNALSNESRTSSCDRNSSENLNEVKAQDTIIINIEQEDVYSRIKDTTLSLSNQVCDSLLLPGQSNVDHNGKAIHLPIENISSTNQEYQNINEKPNKRNRKFRRKNSLVTATSQPTFHRKEIGKAAKRLCLWKQKLAKSHQNHRNMQLSTTNDFIPLNTLSVTSDAQTSSSTRTDSYANPRHNEKELYNIKSLFSSKQSSSKKSKKNPVAPPQIILSSPSLDLPDEAECALDADNTSEVSFDSNTVHSSDYDSAEKISFVSNGNLMPHRSSDSNSKRRGMRSYSSMPRRPFRLRRTSRRLGCNGHQAEFTVVPVKNETNLREQESAQKNNADSSSLRVPISPFEIDGEPTDTLTQNSITSLLSAKFRDVAKRWKQYGVESPRFRKRIHSKWESMNYDSIDSMLSREKEHDTSKRKLAMQWIAHWFIYFLIGVGTAFLAAGVQISVEIIAHEKFELIKQYLDKCSNEGCLIIPVLIWVAFNAGITLLGAALVTYVQPMAAGSGIPLIKSYLNGVRVPGLLSLRAFIAKCVGVILSILGGLACGKEGPMAHSGGIMGAGLGKGRIPWFNRHISVYGMFRNDHNIRDLVAAGAASGVSAAFGAPVGGTLFSVEEAASFWNTELVWKVFFSAMIACFSTNFMLSAFEGHPTQLSNPGLVRFNTFPNLTFDLIEIPVFIFLAVIGGLTGSLFVVMNYKLTVFRQKYLHRHKWIKVVEAAVVAVTSAIVAFILMYTVNDCTEAVPRSHHAIVTKMGCEGNAHNAMSTLFLTTPEGCLKSLLHDPLETYSVLSLVLFIIIFFLLGVWTYGLSVSSGVFIPSLAIGAAWGRLIGMGVVELFPDQAKDVGKYALIGAASQLGGILRTTISLTVIIVECTGDITFGLCIMISLMISKWVGDFFTTGLYDMNVEVSGIPLLSWEPPPLCDHVKVSDFMSQPVMSLLEVEKVGHVMECLNGETFHGFPIIEQDPSYELMYRGKLRGLMLRSQLLVLLKHKVFCPEGQKPQKIMDLGDFENPYPVSEALKVQDIELTEEEKDYVIDFGPYMSQTPYIVSPNFSMPRTFRLFRGLGLRHLIVINEEFEPIGMVTRKDLAKYRAGIKKGMLHMEQLTVENR